MTQYQVDSFSITLHTGKVKLSDEQAVLRAGSLKKAGRGAYEVIAPIQFKRGETFGYDGDLPKNLVAEVVVAKEEAAKTEG